MTLQDVTASEVMNTEHPTVSKDQTLAQIKDKMEEEGVRAIPVVTDGKFDGAIGYRELIRLIQFHNNPETTNPEKVIHNPPHFDADDSLAELAKLRLNSGRKMMVHEADGKLKGVIGDREFANAFQGLDEFRNVSTRTIGTTDVEIVYEDDKSERGRHLMLDKNFSTLPVIDSEGRLTGIVQSTDFLKMMAPIESPNPGGTSGNRSGRVEVNIAGGNEKVSLADITVDQVMDRTPNVVEGFIDADEAIDEMIEQGGDTGHYNLVITKDDYPEAIVTLKDLIDYAAGYAPTDTVLVQLTGLEVPEEKALILNKVKKQLQGSLGRKMDNPEEVTLHIKKSDKDGKRHRFDVNLKLYSRDFGLITVNEDGWDMMEVIDEALNELNKVVRKEKEKRDDRRHQKL